MLTLLAQTEPHRGPDGGPIYAETNLDHFIAEPFNALSALLFLGIAAYWLIRLRGRYRQYAFLVGCLPLLIVGGLGGTVYHAFRAHRVWLVMDWLPIVLLSFAVTVYLWAQLLAKRWPIALLIPPIVFGIQRVNFGLVRDGTIPVHWAINASYSMLVIVGAVPAALVLRRTRFAHGRWFLATIGCFAAAILARGFDHRLASLLPMGSHFLWHAFGAGATQCLATYLYLYRRDRSTLPAGANATRELFS
jgi:hypothetical protein